METWIIYDPATGAIRSQAAGPPGSAKMQTVPDGLKLSLVDQAPVIEASYVVGSAVKPRVDINWDAIPADALVSVNGAAAVAGVKPPTAAGTYLLRAVGKYRGERVVTNLTLPELEVDLIDAVKTEAERRRMLVMSPGGSKKTVYSLKQSEVDTWNDLGGTLATSLTAFLGLSPIKQKRKFRFAMAEAALRGEANPAAAIARFASGSDTANAEAARIEAIEQAGVSAIKAATTIVAKRAAYAAVNWNWSA